MLEVGLAQRAGGQDDHPGLVGAVRRRPGHPAPDGSEEAGQAFGSELAVQRRQHPREDGSVDQGVAQTGGGLDPVAEGSKLAPPVAGHVHRSEEQARTGAAHSHTGPEEAGMAEDQLGGDEPVGQQPTFPVDVGEHELEEGSPLGHGCFEAGPFGLVDDQWTRVEPPGPPPAVIVQGHVVGGAFVAE